MSARGRVHGLVTLGVAALVGLLGAAVAGPDGRAAVWLGALAAGGIQAMLFAAVPLWLGPSRRFLAYGLGALARFGAFAAVALLGLPLLRVPAAPLLFSLAVVFFLTTLLEPFFLHTREAE